MRAVTGKPIKLLGVGEKWDALEDFHPSRVASRILGMGDVVSLVEKAAQTIDVEKAQKIAQKMKKGAFDLDDMAEQLKQMQKIGGMSGVLGMMPGMGKIKSQIAEANLDDGDPQAPARHHHLDDAEGAPQPQGARCQAQAAHRGRLRHQGRGGQPPHQDAPADGGHDEDAGAQQGHAQPADGRRRRRARARPRWPPCRRSSASSIPRRSISSPRISRTRCPRGSRASAAARCRSCRASAAACPDWAAARKFPGLPGKKK